MIFILKGLLILGVVSVLCDLVAPWIDRIYKPLTPPHPEVKPKPLPTQVYYFGNMPLREDKHATHPGTRNPACDAEQLPKDEGGLKYFSE